MTAAAELWTRLSTLARPLLDTRWRQTSSQEVDTSPTLFKTRHGVAPQTQAEVFILINKYQTLAAVAEVS